MERDDSFESAESFHLEINGERFECTPNNTIAIIHPEELKDYDCLIVKIDDDPKLMFRESCEGFDDCVEIMLHNDYLVEVQDVPSDIVKQIYLNQFGRDAKHKTKELTMRQERRIDFLAFLLEGGHLTPEDFNGNGELYI